MLDIFIGPILTLIFPRAPAWVAKLIAAALPAVAELVEALDEAKDRAGTDRFTFVVQEVSELLDDGLDEIPEWSKLEEDQRDRILGGLVELCLFINRASSTKKNRVNVRRALRKIKQGAK
tara:strand:- start:657 stop:1016 length:360 start_codon:yes stop_codon:yes gene_type:complete